MISEQSVATTNNHKSIPWAITDRLVQIAQGSTYPPEAYFYVIAGLDCGYRKRPWPECLGHPTIDDPRICFDLPSAYARLYCETLTSLAGIHYGLMAEVVLNSWNIRECSNFGAIICDLLAQGVLQTQGSSRSSLGAIRGHFQDATPFGYADFRSMFNVKNCIEIDLEHQVEPVL